MHQRLAIVSVDNSEEIASTIAQKNDKQASNSILKLNARIKKYDESITNAGIDVQDLRQGLHHSEKRIRELERETEQITTTSKQLDENVEEARMQTLLMPYTTDADCEAAEEGSSSKQEVATANSTLGPFGSSLLDIFNYNIPKLFNTGGGHVAWEFAIKPTLEPEPSNRQEEMLIQLERSEDSDEPIQQHRWLKNMDDFLNKHVRTSELPSSSQESTRVKVALIDDGVDAHLEQFKGFIHPKGWPQGEPTSSDYPFYHSATGHGTEMAKLIQMICPHALLYVAKLGAWTDKERIERLGEGSTAANAKQAVAWAIKQRVDIISMSWSLVRTDASDGSPSNEEQIRLLDEQIQEAARRGIIMYCAAADEGLYGSHKELYPKKAETEHIKAVGSANESGSQSKFVDASQVDYLFPGEEIPELGERKGSSAATAIAAGFAALIIWCFLCHLGNTGANKVSHPKKMHHLFTKLRANDTKWINATKMFREGSSIADVVSHWNKVLDTMEVG